MKLPILLFAISNFFLCSVRGQNVDKLDFNYFTADVKSDFVGDIITPRKLIGNWISMHGDIRLTIYQEGSDVLVGGDYFHNVAAQGDRAVLTVSPYPTWMKKDPQLRQIKIFYSISHIVGGGGSDVAIAYSPKTGHLIIGESPYNVLENGQWVSHSGTFTNTGIYGFEFKRVIPSREPSSLHIGYIQTTPPGFETLDCTYSRTPGGLPIIFTNMTAGAVINIDGQLTTLKLQKTGKDKSGKLMYVFVGNGFEATIRTGQNFKKGLLTVKGPNSFGGASITGGCMSDGGD